MTGNSSNFTDANRRVCQPRLRLFGRGADRATMIEAVSGVSITVFAEETNTWRIRGGRKLALVEKGHQHQISI